MTTSKEVKLFSPRDRQCYFSDERSLKYFKIYNPENCGLECLTNYTLKLCGCVDFYMPRQNVTKVCGNAMKTCLEEALYAMKEMELTSLLEKVNVGKTCNCMPLCTELTYDAETSTSSMPWREQFRADSILSGRLDAGNTDLSDM
ncbi:hypothetical protein JTB14_037316 [Gonioctena quinquepunctata]|nr:hypothetical protein JTB14_037316 [Gonioctena quinquepunctata]